MTYADKYDLLTLAERAKANTVSIVLNEGTYRMLPSEALETLDHLYPGEYFQIISINFE